MLLLPQSQQYYRVLQLLQSKNNRRSIYPQQTQKFLGTLNGTMRVFVDQYASDSTDILVGYKGDGEMDAAAFSYRSTYPLMSSGTVLDPSTFEPVVSL